MASVRWYLKKAARKGMAVGTEALRTLAAARGPRGETRVRALTYHRFGSTLHDPFCVPAEEFERQMQWLAKEERAVSLADVQAFIAGQRDLPDGSVLVTIDDGCPSVHAAALPILQRHEIPVVIFVPAGEVDADADGPRRRSSVEAASDRVTVAELRALADAGCAIGSHAWMHESLGRMSHDACRDQAVRSRDALERMTGCTVTAFAYPFGTRADYNGATSAVLREAGYVCAFTSQHGAIRRGLDPFLLPRVKVEGGERLWMFKLLVDGALDGWSWIDRWFWRVQQRAG